MPDVGVLNGKSADLLKQNQGPLTSPALQNANHLSAPFGGGKSVLNANIQDQARLNQYGIAGNVGSINNAQELDVNKGINPGSSLTTKTVSNASLGATTYL